MSFNKGTKPIDNVNDLQKYLSAVNYPASKEDIYNSVKKHDTNMNVITLVQALPDQQYHTPREVMLSIGLHM